MTRGSAWGAPPAAWSTSEPNRQRFWPAGWRAAARRPSWPPRTPPPERAGRAEVDDLARLEAILFLAREPLGSRKLAQLAGLADGTKARTLVRTLNRRYDAGGCAFRAEEVAGGFQLLTRAKFVRWLRRVQTTQSEVRLSAPAMETLAVVAYRQPVLRAEIEAIRGVQCDEVLRQLGERGLVRVVGRSRDLGRPLLYGTTRRFLQIFGLRHSDELSRGAWIDTTTVVADSPTTDNTQNQEAISQKAVEEDAVRTLLKPNPVVDDISEREAFLIEAQELRNARDDEEGDDEDFDDEDDDEDEEWDEDDDEDFDDEEEEEEVDEDLDEDDWEEVEDEEEEDEEWDDDEEDEDWDDDEDEDEEWDEDEEDEDDEE